MKSLFAGFCAAALFAAASFAAEPQPILLWPKGAPGSEGKTSPETVRIYPPDEQVISNINFPSITPYLPYPDNANGAAVIVVPGGGHREIWITHEGYRVAQFLAGRGVAAFVLKYRLSEAPGSTYTLTGDSAPDVQRAIRLVRSHAVEWNIAPDRIGVMGFSAGGELAALAGTRFDAGNQYAPDPIDRESSRPAFMGLIYPYVGRIFPTSVTLTKDTPPAFLLGGEKDEISRPLPELYLALERAGVPAELHMLSGVGHGFGIRPTNPPHVEIWTTLFYNWLDTVGMLKAE
ncbi:MAG: alpha/beta hydrolase [Alphaproteobacteria bacterium]|nr:alpha/beta hydrolase [Alphaproteobacteria bacterium]MDE2630964.1 alpha/beta hydrolase [Alphaproteobacteria bacterium]